MGHAADFDSAAIRAALECSPAAVMITDSNGVILWVNAGFTAVTGYAPEEAIGQTPRLLKSGRHDAAFYSGLWTMLRAGLRWRGEIINRRKSGELYVAEQTISPVPGSASGVAYFVATQIDVTEHKRAEEELARRERDLEEAQRLAGVGSWEWSSETRTVTWSEELYRIMGIDPRSPLPHFTEHSRFFEPGTWARFCENGKVTFGSGTPFELGGEIKRPDGTARWVVTRGEAVRDESGRIIGLRGTIQDMTERKRAEDALRDSDSALRALLNATSDTLLLLDANGTVLVANETAAQRMGTTADAIPGACAFDLLPDAVATRRWARFREAIETGREVRFEDSRGDASLESCIYPVPDVTGRITRAAVYGRDVTEAKKKEEALRESERRFRQLLENVGVLAVVVDSDWKIIFCNDYLLRVTGWSREELIGSTWLERCIPPRERDNLKALFRGTGSGNTFPLHHGNAILTKNGSERWIEWDNSPLWGRDGRFAGTASLGRDLTDQRTLEEQLRQSQKLHAVGRLAGGVAHDFNNLLTVISGYTELLLSAHARGDSSHSALQAIRAAAQRATELVQQLLAFSRKQLLQPRVLDVRLILKESVKMLRRLIREDIKLTCRVEPDLPAIEADPGQIHQVIMNLALNARDSMPRGGSLAIEATASTLDEAYAACYPDVQPGRYVRLAFRDTGQGIDEKTREHLFEPFFTTKGVGKGTGLGLSTVYGVVKQSGGHVTVSSEPGHGTTFEVYLPALDRKAPKPQRRAAPATGNRGTILMVEDDPDVRAFSAASLRRTGYNVIEAAEGAAALRLFGADPATIDLLVTDMVMPGMSGTELAERVRKLRPDMKVLFVSGYTNRRRLSRGDMAFLPKPYSPHALDASVRKILKGGRAGAAGEGR